MTRTLNIKTGLTAFAATLALSMNLLAAPAAMAGDRGRGWNGGNNHRVEHHVARNPHRRAHRLAPRWHIHRHAPRRVYRPVYVERRDFPVGAVIAGIGLGIITHAILTGPYHD